MELTQAEYARRKGVSRQAVLIAVRDGRLQTVMRRGRKMVVCSEDDFATTGPAVRGAREPAPPAGPSPGAATTSDEELFTAFPFAVDADPSTREVLRGFLAVASFKKIVTSPVYAANLKYLQVKFPEHFGDKQKGRTFTPEDYEKAIGESLKGNGQTPGALDRLVSEHVREHGFIAPEVYQRLKEAVEGQEVE